MKGPNLIWKEPAYRSSTTVTPVNRLIVSKQSKFQDLKVVELQGLGRVLLTDGFTQSAEVDEFCYHEALVHPAMLMHPNPKTVFIGGGGEGATLREVLKHPSVEKVVMVDIDQDLVEFCKTHLPEWSDGAFEDKRVEVHYADARAYLETRGQSFDVIIMDICDPSKGSECVKLYEQEFYQKLQQNGVLNPGFVLVTQSGPAGLCSLREVGSVIHNTLKQVFRHVVPFGCHVPSFFDRWGFNLACDSKFDRCQTVEQINEELARRRITSKFYDGSCHQALFGLPKTLACIYAEETRVITEKTPCFMNSDYEQTTGELLEE